MHAFAPAQDTLRRSPYAPPGVGVGSIDHFLPFQPSASVGYVVWSLVYWPTAAQALRDAQETPLSWL